MASAAARLRAALFDAQDGDCAICGRNLYSADCAEVDHVIPLSAGGSDSASNAQATCATCNRAKGSLDPRRVWQQVCARAAAEGIDVPDFPTETNIPQLDVLAWIIRAGRAGRWSAPAAK